MPVVVLLASLARTAAAAGTGFLTPARKLKDTAVEKLKPSPASPVESGGTKALNLLEVARKLLLKHEKPLPQEVFDELAEVNALVHWARAKLPEDSAATVEVPPLLNPNGKGREELALEYFLRARGYANRNPDDHFMIAVRYLEVAERFEGTVVSSEARVLAARHGRLAARASAGAAEKQPAGTAPGGRETADAPRPDPARGRQALARLLAEIDSLIGRGDHAAALARVEKAVADPAFEDFTDETVAAHGVCDSLDARRKAVRAAVEEHLGKEIELRTTKGKLLGKVQRVTHEGVDLLIRKKVPGMGAMETRFDLKWSDLAPKQEHDLARRGGWKPDGRDGAVVRAYVALAREDRAAAARALADASDHPLAARVRRRIGSPKREAAERAARAAWQGIERAAGVAKTSAGEVRRLIGKIDAFENRYRHTKFAASVREAAAAMKRRAMRSLLPKRGLVAHWPLDESEGTTARDVSGNGHHGTLTGGVTWRPAEGRIGGAVACGNGYVDCGTVPGSTAAVSVVFWMKARGTAHQIPVDKNPNGGGGRGWTFKLRAGGGMYMQVGSARAFARLAIPSVYAPGNWVHVAFTFDRGRAAVYVDGTERSSKSGITHTVADTMTRFAIGRPSVVCTRERFRGLLDDVRVYDRALTAEEVEVLYRVDAPRDKPTAPAAKGTVRLSWTS